MQNFARKENVKVIEKYIGFWNPLNFVTQRDLERAIEKKIGSLDEADEEKTNKKEKHLPFL